MSSDRSMHSTWVLCPLQGLYRNRCEYSWIDSSHQTLCESEVLILNLSKIIEMKSSMDRLLSHSCIHIPVEFNVTFIQWIKISCYLYLMWYAIQLRSLDVVWLIWSSYSYIDLTYLMGAYENMHFYPEKNSEYIFNQVWQRWVFHLVTPSCEWIEFNTAFLSDQFHYTFTSGFTFIFINNQFTHKHIHLFFFFLFHIQYWYSMCLASLYN